MVIESQAFAHSCPIPRYYTCDGSGVNPPLTFGDIPAAAQSLALIVDDPDAPAGLFTHWLVYDLAPHTRGLPKDAILQTGTQGTNDFGTIGYGGPCPPSGTHRYCFHLYALDSALNLQPGASRQQLDTAMRGKVLAEAELIGLYDKTPQPAQAMAA